MKKTVLFILGLIVCSSMLLATGNDAITVGKAGITKNMVYGEAGLWIMGNSVNVSYERILLAGAKGYFSAAGSYGRWKDEYEDGNLVGISGNYLYGKGNHQMEFGLGGIIKVHYDQYYTNQNKYDHITLLPDLFLGYRYKKPAGHLVLKAGVGFPSLASVGVGFAF